MPTLGWLVEINFNKIMPNSAAKLKIKQTVFQKENVKQYI